MKNIQDQVDEIHKHLTNLSSSVNDCNDIVRFHTNNLFNRRFSAVLGSFSDLEHVGLRLERTILQYENIERDIRTRLQGKKEISDDMQSLMRVANRLSGENQADFKSLYVFAKIFLDEYTALLAFVNNWRGISNGSVTKFYNSLSIYDGNDNDILRFKGECLNRLKAVDIFVTQYRDKYIVHDQTKHKETRWFISDMEGGVNFIGGRPSITPRELMFVVCGYVSTTSVFTRQLLNKAGL